MTQWKRIGKNKTQIVGCVTYGQINKSQESGGYLTLRTTATRDLWVYVPPVIFRELVDEKIRDRRDYGRTPYTEAEARKLITWLRAKMIVIQCETWTNGELVEYRCHTRGILEGKD